MHRRREVEKRQHENLPSSYAWAPFRRIALYLLYTASIHKIYIARNPTPQFSCSVRRTFLLFFSDPEFCELANCIHQDTRPFKFQPNCSSLWYECAKLIYSSTGTRRFFGTRNAHFPAISSEDVRTLFLPRNVQPNVQRCSYRRFQS